MVEECVKPVMMRFVEGEGLGAFQGGWSMAVVALVGDGRQEWLRLLQCVMQGRERDDVDRGQQLRRRLRRRRRRRRGEKLKNQNKRKIGIDYKLLSLLNAPNQPKLKNENSHTQPMADDA